MDEKDLARHRRAVEDAPEDPETWLAFARDLTRADRLTPKLDPALLQPLLVAWRRAPDARELERFFQAMTGLVPIRHDQPRPGWLDEARVDVEEPRSAPYHRELGLSLATVRLEDHAYLWLWPGGPVRLAAPGAAVEFDLLPGYVHPQVAPFLEPDFAVTLLDLEGFDRRVAGMGEGVPSVPDSQDQPLPVSSILGRRLGHGLTPEDCQPLPPPPRPYQPIGVPPPRLSGAPPSPRLGGAVPEPFDPAPRRGWIQWFEDLFDS